MVSSDLVGLIAAFLTTISFLPQTIKSIKTHDTKALSLPMYILFTVGIALWLIYGIMIQSLPIILANSVTIILSTTILYLKIKNG